MNNSELVINNEAELLAAVIGVLATPNSLAETEVTYNKESIMNLFDAIGWAFQSWYNIDVESELTLNPYN